VRRRVPRVGARRERVLVHPLGAGAAVGRYQALRHAVGVEAAARVPDDRLQPHRDLVAADQRRREADEAGHVRGQRPREAPVRQAGEGFGQSGVGVPRADDEAQAREVGRQRARRGGRDVRRRPAHPDRQVDAVLGDPRQRPRVAPGGAAGAALPRRRGGR